MGSIDLLSPLRLEHFGVLASATVMFPIADTVPRCPWQPTRTRQPQSRRKQRSSVSRSLPHGGNRSARRTSRRHSSSGRLAVDGSSLRLKTKEVTSLLTLSPQKTMGPYYGLRRRHCLPVWNTRTACRHC